VPLVVEGDISALDNEPLIFFGEKSRRPRGKISWYDSIVANLTLQFGMG
jgi:hypothetical protein